MEKTERAWKSLWHSNALHFENDFTKVSELALELSNYEDRL